MGAINPPYSPTFGSGAPAGGAPQGQIYFDVSNNYAGYVGRNGTWHQFSSGVAPPPAAIVQGAINSGSITGATFVSAITAGNLLVAMCSHAQNNITISPGWTQILNNNGGIDGNAAAWKIAGVGESDTQNPFSNINQGVIGIYEISGGTQIIDQGVQQHDIAASPTITQNVTTTKTSEVGLVLFTNNNTGGVTSETGYTQDETIATVGRTGSLGHFAAATAATYSPACTFTTNGTATSTCVTVQ